MHQSLLLTRVRTKEHH